MDDGLLNATRTKGGHRRIDPAELLRQVENGSLPQLDLATVRLALRQTHAVDCNTTRLKEFLLKGDQAQARRLIQDAWSEGGMEQVADTLVAGAMHDVGMDWQTGKIDVLHEHRATELCLAILYQLVPQVVARSKRMNPPKVAIGCSPSKDQHQVASLLAQMLLEEAGWTARSLGGGISANTLEDNIQQSGAHIAWISATNVPSLEALIDEFAGPIGRMRTNGVEVIVGGLAINEPAARRLNASAWGSKLSDIVKLARPWGATTGDGRGSDRS
jgi:methanogenic corrinoid protein MtbC1